MKWTSNRSGNVDDRRGKMRGGKIVGGGIGTILIMVVIYFLGGDPTMVQNLQQGAIGSSDSQTERELTDEELKIREFISMLTSENELSWQVIFKENNLKFRPATVVLFEEATQSGCGAAQSAMGPFYCPADQKLYIDLSFYDQLSQEYGASGDFAMAYVVAHEVGHHVQNLLGIMDQVQGYRGQVIETEYNELNVRLELQADYLAGVWANYVREQGVLEAGDFEEALTAAHAVGDDTLQKQYQGYVVPDSFTHGTSEQRMRWFTKGFETGDLSGGDAFNIGYDEL